MNTTEIERGIAASQRLDRRLCTAGVRATIGVSWETVRSRAARTGLVALHRGSSPLQAGTLLPAIIPTVMYLDANSPPDIRALFGHGYGSYVDTKL
jgi:hypothetical protein